MKRPFYALGIVLILLLSHQAMAQISGCANPVNLISNGDFSTGSLSPGTSSLSHGCGVCATDQYCIGDDTHDKCVTKMSFTGNGDFMTIDGTDSGNPGYYSFWSQSVSVQRNQPYTITFRVRDQYSTASISAANFFIRIVANGQVIGFSPDFQNGKWTVVSFPWVANTTGNITFQLQITEGAYRDFAIDDIFFGYCEEPCAVNAGFEYRQKEGSCEWKFSNLSQAGNNSSRIGGYYWEFGDGSTSTDAHPVHYYAGPGAYQVCLTTYAMNEAGECCSDTHCLELENNCDNESCQIEGDFEVSGLGYCTYSFRPSVSGNSRVIGYTWDFGDGSTSADPNPIHFYNRQGTYKICLTVMAIARNGECCMLRRYYEINVTEECHKPDDDMKTTGAHIGLFPNPADNLLHLQLYNISEEAGTGSVHIFDSSGRLLEKLTRQILFDKETNRLTLDISPFSPGLYIINIKLNGRVFSKKFIKK